jgi:hypothetical protein
MVSGADWSRGRRTRFIRTRDKTVTNMAWLSQLPMLDAVCQDASVGEPKKF